MVFLLWYAEDWCFVIGCICQHISWRRIKRHLYLYRKKKSGSLLTQTLPKKKEYVEYMRNKYGEEIKRIVNAMRGKQQ